MCAFFIPQVAVQNQTKSGSGRGLSTRRARRARRIFFEESGKRGNVDGAQGECQSIAIDCFGEDRPACVVRQ
jgi:hypothetical protein